MKMMDNRAYDAGKGMSDSHESIQRAGGEDPRRYDAKIVIDRKIMDHSQSGYNHNGTSDQPANGAHENEMFANMQDRKAHAMGTPEPNGTYKR